tara:strand:+ start:289 stop:450 length:162 start_codon:yes stop_codon:yes gene_type:complete
MSRRKNGVRKEWKRKLTEIYQLKKKLKKKPNNNTLDSNIKALCSRAIMPKKNK